MSTADDREEILRLHRDWWQANRDWDIPTMRSVFAGERYLQFNFNGHPYYGLEEKTKALTDLEKATAGVADVDRKVEELQEAIKFFEKKLPQERDIDQILKEVWNMAEKNQLTTKTIKTMKSQRGATYSEQPIEMTLSGNFNGFYEFLLKLERLPRLTRVSQLNLDKIGGKEGEMEAKLVLSIFFEPETAGASAR